MNLRTRLSRSNGYRELGMFDESINELESIEGDEKWEYPILKAKYQTYWEAEAYDLAEAITRGMRIHHPHLTEGWLMEAECLNKLKGAKEAAEFLLKDEEENGLFTAWYENGQKKEETNYKEGKKHGLSTVWNLNGQRYWQKYFENGKQIGGTKTESLY